MRVLGIDPGLGRCGFAVLDRDSGTTKAVSYGTVVTGAGPVPARLAELASRLRQVISEYRPDVAAIEQLFVNRNIRTAMTVGQASGIALMVAAEAGLTVASYTPSQVKLAITGTGTAPKGQIGFMVKAMLGLPALARPADSADAIAVALCHLQHGALGGDTSAADGPLAGSAQRVEEQWLRRAAATSPSLARSRRELPATKRPAGRVRPSPPAVVDRTSRPPARPAGGEQGRRIEPGPPAAVDRIAPGPAAHDPASQPWDRPTQARQPQPPAVRRHPPAPDRKQTATRAWSPAEQPAARARNPEPEQPPRVDWWRPGATDRPADPGWPSAQGQPEQTGWPDAVPPGDVGWPQASAPQAPDPGQSGPAGAALGWQGAPAEAPDAGQGWSQAAPAGAAVGWREAPAEASEPDQGWSQASPAGAAVGWREAPAGVPEPGQGWSRAAPAGAAESWRGAPVEAAGAGQDWSQAAPAGAAVAWREAPAEAPGAAQGWDQAGSTDPTGDWPAAPTEPPDAGHGWSQTGPAGAVAGWQGAPTEAPDAGQGWDQAGATGDWPAAPDAASDPAQGWRQAPPEDWPAAPVEDLDAARGWGLRPEGGLSPDAGEADLVIEEGWAPGAGPLPGPGWTPTEDAGVRLGGEGWAAPADGGEATAALSAAELPDAAAAADMGWRRDEDDGEASGTHEGMDGALAVDQPWRQADADEAFAAEQGWEPTAPVDDAGVAPELDPGWRQDAEPAPEAGDAAEPPAAEDPAAAAEPDWPDPPPAQATRPRQPDDTDPFGWLADEQPQPAQRPLPPAGEADGGWFQRQARANGAAHFAWLPEVDQPEAGWDRS